MHGGREAWRSGGHCPDQPEPGIVREEAQHTSSQRRGSDGVGVVAAWRGCRA